MLTRSTGYTLKDSLSSRRRVAATALMRRYSMITASTVGSATGVHVSFTADELASGKADYNFGDTDPGEEMPGVSVFWKDDAGEVFHTYSTYGRGVEVMMHTYRLLDLTPKGRDEGELTYTMEWVRHHDRYELAPAAKASGSCCGG